MRADTRPAASPYAPRGRAATSATTPVPHDFETARVELARRLDDYDAAEAALDAAITRLVAAATVTVAASRSDHPTDKETAQ